MILELHDELNVTVAAGHRVLISVIQLAHAAALNFSTLEECYDFFRAPYNFENETIDLLESHKETDLQHLYTWHKARQRYLFNLTATISL